MSKKSLVLLLALASCSPKSDSKDPATGQGGSIGASGDSTGAKGGSSGSGGATGTGGSAAGTGGSGSGGTVGTGTGGASSGGDAAVSGTSGSDAKPASAGDAAGGPGTPTDPTQIAGTPFVFIDGTSGIAVFKLDMATGALTRQSTLDAARKSYLAFSADKKFVYGIGAGQTVVSMTVDSATGALAKIAGGDPATGGKDSAHLAVHPGGKWVIVSNWTSGDVQVLPVGANGLAGMVADRQMALAEAHQVMIDPTGKFVFVPGVKGNGVTQWVFDDKTGKLTPNTPPKADAPGVRHLAFHPTKAMAYTIAETTGAVTSFAYDKAKGTLSDPQVIMSMANPPENAGGHIEVHPSGKFVYVTNRGNNNIGMFSVDANTSRLTLIGLEDGGGSIRIPRDFTIDPTGTYLLVASQNYDSVANIPPIMVFKINLADGKLTKTGAGVPAGMGVPQQPLFVAVRFLP